MHDFSYLKAVPKKVVLAQKTKILADNTWDNSKLHVLSSKEPYMFHNKVDCLLFPQKNDICE